MGLDWCLEPPIKLGLGEKAQDLLSRIEGLENQINTDYRYFKSKEENKEKSSLNYLFEDNARLLQAFRKEKEQEFKTLNSLKGEYRSCFVQPYEVLKSPIVGQDEKADNYIKSQYKEIYLLGNDGVKPKMTEEEFLDACRGEPIYHLSENQEGIALVSGMMVNPTSFRGKVLNYISFLSETLKEEAYIRHSPDQLKDYGQRLLIVHDTWEGPGTEENNESLKLLKAAATWAIFWGSQGFGMNPWY